jgi:hypothetical protein
MPIQTGIPVINTFGVSSLASGSTAATALVPPCPGPPGSPPYLFNATALTNANWLYKAPLFGVPHVESIRLNTSSTAHSFIIFRPLNWTYFPAGLAKNTTAIPDSVLTGIATDPGLYSTSYGYPTVGGVAPGQVADAAVSSTNKLVAYQLADGSWVADTIASGTFGSTLTLTTGTPNRTGGAIPAGGVLFYFGAVAGTLLDPANGQLPFILGTKASADASYLSNLAGIFSGLHPGDPLLVYDGNGTAADSFHVAGYYGQY